MPDLLEYASNHRITDGEGHFNEAFKEQLRSAGYAETKAGEWVPLTGGEEDDEEDQVLCRVR